MSWDIPEEEEEGAFQGVISNARFGTMPNYANGEATLFMFNLLRPSDGSIIGDPDRPRFYSVGKGWKATDDGMQIVSDEYDNLSMNTNYGKFIKRVVKKLVVPMSDRGESPCNARVWNGLCFRWKNESYTALSGDEKDRLMPVEYIQEVDVGAYGGGVTTKTLAKAADEAMSDEVRDTLTELALNVEGNDKIGAGNKAAMFRVSARKLPIVADNDTLKALFSSRENAKKFYTSAVGEEEAK